jgi:hypothetical protein
MCAPDKLKKYVKYRFWFKKIARWRALRGERHNTRRLAACAEKQCGGITLAPHGLPARAWRSITACAAAAGLVINE